MTSAMRGGERAREREWSHAQARDHCPRPITSGSSYCRPILRECHQHQRVIATVPHITRIPSNE